MSTTSILAASSSVDTLPQNEAGEFVVERKQGRVVTLRTRATFLKESPVIRKRRSGNSNSGHSSGFWSNKASSPGTSLPTIPESDEIEPGNDTREVIIVSMLECPEFYAAGMAEEVLNKVHDSISGHPSFSSVKNTSEILEGAFAHIQVAFSRVSIPSDIHPCISCTTLVISGNEVCLGHVGKCHAAIINLDGQLAQITKAHDSSRSFGTSMRWVPDTCHFQIQVPESGLDSPRKSYSLARKRSRSRSGLFASLFAKPVPSDGEKSPDVSKSFSSSVVIVLGSAGIWSSFGRQNVSDEILDSLSSPEDDISAAAKALVQKASKKAPCSVAACVIRFNKM